MIAFAEAQRRVLARCTPLDAETIALADADGRVLAGDLYAPDDLVPFPRSAMDGFALASGETLRSREFHVKGAVFAQAAQPLQHALGTASAIATGGPLPLGADAVVPIEEVVRLNGSIRLERPLRPGEHVFDAGEDARRGDRLVLGGTTLEPPHLGLLAAAGFAQLSVRRRPRVAIVCGGDELVPVEAVPTYGQIRNSNASIVRASVVRAGGIVMSESTIGDASAPLCAALCAAFDHADLVITTGGASVGERDLIKPLLHDLGAAFAFDSIAMRPGRPTAFATVGATQIAVLAGNPAAVFVALAELVAPAVAALQGCRTPRLPRIGARLGEAVHAKAQRLYLPFVRLHWDGGFVATPLANQCSALTRTAAEAHGLAVIEPRARGYAAGDEVAVDVYRWEGAAAADPID
ncbi:MAG: molybdopterin molybdotransferase MoeA [Candidatus Eremiobacteraeota bacterium]|nr:molybdopterin molybdotransferase MoeA [Candidatus Eremiobacteraeota bacterium]